MARRRVVLFFVFYLINRHANILHEMVAGRVVLFLFFYLINMHVICIMHMHACILIKSKTKKQLARNPSHGIVLVLLHSTLVPCRVPIKSAV